VIPLGRGERAERVLRAALERWGIPSQIGMTIEECGELIVKLTKLDRKHNGSTIEEVSEEMADVRVMLDQMEIAFDNWEIIARIYAEKITKLEKMLGLDEESVVEKSKITKEDYYRAFDKR